jgi:hypothetical protein
MPIRRVFSDTESPILGSLVLYTVEGVAPSSMTQKWNHLKRSLQFAVSPKLPFSTLP